MKVLVLGASGFVGSHLVAHLLERQREVEVLLLPGEDRQDYADRLATLASGIGPPEIHVGTLPDPQVLGELLERSNQVYYLVGCMRGRRREAYWQVNVELLQKCLSHPAWTEDHRLVLLSSVAALGPSTETNPLSEDALPQPVGFYGASKRAGEEVLERSGFPGRWTILRPPSLYGPGDPCFLDVFRLARSGIFLALGPRELRYQLVFIRDLAVSLVQAMEALGEGRDLPPYLHLGNPRALGHEDWRVAFQEALGRPVRTLSLGRWGTRLLGSAAALKEALTGVPELAGPDKAAHLLAGDWVHDLSGYQRVFGERNWTELGEGTLLTHRWYEAHGWYSR